MYLERLQAALPEVRSQIERACERSGRSDAGSIELVGVTKGHPVEALRAASEVGLAVIGESRVQEAADKLELAGDLGLSWHLDGHLQRNKVKMALKLFSLIHSVDSVRLAQAVAKESTKLNRRSPVLVQVNASGEESKSGFEVEEGLAAVREVGELEGVRVVGLMSMAPHSSDEGLLRSVFRRTRELYERCSDELEKFEPRYLSMGMTNDYEIAIEEGSNLVRLGTALFGGREP